MRRERSVFILPPSLAFVYCCFWLKAKGYVRAGWCSAESGILLICIVSINLAHVVSVIAKFFRIQKSNTFDFSITYV